MTSSVPVAENHDYFTNDYYFTLDHFVQSCMQSATINLCIGVLTFQPLNPLVGSVVIGVALTAFTRIAHYSLVTALPTLQEGTAPLSFVLVGCAFANMFSSQITKVRVIGSILLTTFFTALGTSHDLHTKKLSGTFLEEILYGFSSVRVIVWP
ncbi:MAG: hypothetical protein AAGF04_01115 [Chlamydiota bacterium]